VEGIRARVANGQAYVEALVDPDVAAIKAEAEQAKEHNARVRALRARKQEADRAADEYAMRKQQLEQAERQSRELTGRIGEIEQAKAKLLAEAKMPVPGLGLDGDQVTLGGLPFDQASQSQRIRAGFGIAAALSGSLRVVLCRDGSLLDDEARADLARWAQEQDVQVLLEVVGEGAGGIVIEGGMVKAS
jgi:hypothetical protein